LVASQPGASGHRDRNLAVRPPMNVTWLAGSRPRHPRAAAGPGPWWRLV